MAAYGATLLRLILGIVYIMHAYLAAGHPEVSEADTLVEVTDRQLEAADLPDACHEA